MTDYQYKRESKGLTVRANITIQESVTVPEHGVTVHYVIYEDTVYGTRGPGHAQEKTWFHSTAYKDGKMHGEEWQATTSVKRRQEYYDFIAKMIQKYAA